MKTDFKPYPKYKNSGIEWLGEMPEYWKIISCKLRYSIQLGKMLQNNPQSSFDLKVPYLKALNIQWENVDVIRFSEMWASLGDINKYSIQNNDLLVCEGGEVGRAGIVIDPPKNCIIQNALHRVRAKGKNNVKYLMYLLRAIGQSDWFNILCNKATIAHFTSEKFNDLKIILPSSAEQKAIADFLDKKTSHIDSLIQKKEMQIELLKEKRSALITQTVTKGLDLHVKMKDSDVEWLGKIPEHWDMRKLWMLFKIGRGRVISNEEIENNIGIYPVYSSQTKNNGILGKINTYDFEGDYITWTTDGAYAGTVFRRSGRFNCTNVCGTLKPYCNGINLNYFSYSIAQSTFAFIRYDINTKLMNNVMAGISLQVPPLSEQKSIADFLDKETSRIDSLTEKIKKSIELLKEYRSTLITSAVTGKINVCESHEEKVVNISQFQKKEKETPSLFKKTVLGAEIVAQMKDHPHFGRTKFMKTLYLCEAHLEIPIKGEYKREAAGPLDPSIYKMEGIMKKNKWFGVVKKGFMFKYKALENSEGYKHYFDKYWKDYSKQLNQLLLLVNNFTTEQSEIVDTIYAVWNDFLMDGKNPSDHEIIYEIKNNWHESKKRFSDEKLKKAIDWMRKQSLIPKGHGPKTKGQ